MCREVLSSIVCMMGFIMFVFVEECWSVFMFELIDLMFKMVKFFVEDGSIEMF